jgi:hypothetical protein
MYACAKEHIITFFLWKWRFKPSFYRAVGQILTLGLSSLPVCFCDVLPAGLCMSLYAQPIKDNMHNWVIKDNLHSHVNVR